MFLFQGMLHEYLKYHDISSECTKCEQYHTKGSHFPTKAASVTIIVKINLSAGALSDSLVTLYLECCVLILDYLIEHVKTWR